MVTDIARRALDLWDLAGSTLELVGVSENTTFRVETPEGETVVLRVHRLGYHDAEELASEVVWTRALNQVGLSAPAARLSRTGRSHETVDDPVSGETRLVGIAEWVEGETVADLLGADASEADLVPRFAQLGRIAAAIHNQACAWTPPAGFRRHALDANGLMGEEPWWGPFWALPDLTATERARMLDLRRTLHRYLLDWREPETYSLIHADLHTANLVESGDSLHVIDFDDCGFGLHPFELAVALVQYAEHRAYDALEHALATGYRSVRPLSDEALGQVRTLILVRLLALVGWVQARPELEHHASLRALIDCALRCADKLGL